MHVLVSIGNSIFHFSLSCLGRKHDLNLKVAKKLLSIIFKFNMISAFMILSLLGQNGAWKCKVEMSAYCFSNRNGVTCCYLTAKKTLIYNELMSIWRAFSTLTNYFRKLFEFFRSYFQICISWKSHRKVFLEKFAPKTW